MSLSVYKNQPVTKCFLVEFDSHTNRKDTKIKFLEYCHTELAEVHIKSLRQAHTDISEKSKTIMKDKLNIISFEPKHTSQFHDLNISWLEKYFYVEDHDREVLENPQTYIIDNGGYIFMAEYQNKIVGTVALINEKEGCELSKMAIEPQFQGLKFGQQLMTYIINFAKGKEWKELLLYSNTSLENAIYIYRKFGFIEVPFGGSPYSRGDIKMVLKL